LAAQAATAAATKLARFPFQPARFARSSNTEKLDGCSPQANYNVIIKALHPDSPPPSWQQRKDWLSRCGRYSTRKFDDRLIQQPRPPPDHSHLPFQPETSFRDGIEFLAHNARLSLLC